MGRFKIIYLQIQIPLHGHLSFLSQIYLLDSLLLIKVKNHSLILPKLMKNENKIYKMKKEFLLSSSSYLDVDAGIIFDNDDFLEPPLLLKGD